MAAHQARMHPAAGCLAPRLATRTSVGAGNCCLDMSCAQNPLTLGSTKMLMKAQALLKSQNQTVAPTKEVHWVWGLVLLACPCATI